MEMIEKYRDATRRQMPNVPRDLIDALPIDFDVDYPSAKPYIHQTGGWCMAIACADRLFAEVDEGVFVVVIDTEGDEVTLYLGEDLQAAWLRLNNG